MRPGLICCRTSSPGRSVVFVTSAEEFAVHAFDCEAVDYLLKPVSPERLQKALVRVRQRLVGEARGSGAELPAGRFVPGQDPDGEAAGQVE